MTRLPKEKACNLSREIDSGTEHCVLWLACQVARLSENMYIVVFLPSLSVAKPVHPQALSLVTIHTSAPGFRDLSLFLGTMTSPAGRRKPTRLGVRPGRLVIVGSGIKSMSQFTFEAVSHIEQADKVFYCVADPANDTFIEKHAKEAVDLYDLDDDGKPRDQTYTQMVEKMLQEV